MIARKILFYSSKRGERPTCVASSARSVHWHRRPGACEPSFARRGTAPTAGIKGSAGAFRIRGRPLRHRTRAGRPAHAGFFRKRHEQLRRTALSGKLSFDGPTAGSAHEHPGTRRANHAGFFGTLFQDSGEHGPRHRDRVAFLRVCSGKFTRGIWTIHGRLNKEFKLTRPLHFFAQEREIIEEAWPGDIVGLVDTTGDFRIGDTLCEGKQLEYEGVPRFSPEFFAGVVLNDPMKRKQLKKGLEQLTEEGVIQIFHQPGRGEAQPILGAVGALQFEVLQHRMKAEYTVDMRLERLSYKLARWITAKDSKADFDSELRKLGTHADNRLLEDRDGLPVCLFATEWGANWAEQNYKSLCFLATAPAIRE